MSKDKFINLLEKYFENELTHQEREELEDMVNTDEEIKQEFNDQKRIKEVLSKMRMKNPSKEVWDSYWFGIYNKIERGIAWIAISIGAILLIGFGAIQAVEKFLEDTQTPVVVKYGLAVLVIGFVILMISIIREKFFTTRKDKYKEIQR